VHLHPVRLAGLDDTGVLKAAVPPAMEGGRTQRLEAVRVHDRDLGCVLARDLTLLPARRLDLREEQVLVRVTAKDEQLEFLAELLGGEGQVPNFSALGPYPYAAPAEVEPLGQGLRPAVASKGDLARMLSALGREEDAEKLRQFRRLIELEHELGLGIDL
jgi:hypothetical protein